MAELDLTNAFNDCVDRLAQGQSIDECLRRYPQFASALRPMLEAGLLVRRIQIQPADVAASQMRVRRRFEDALRAPPPRRTSPISRVVLALAAVLIVGVVSIGSLTALSQGSLPGDSLYGVKTFSEGLQQSLFDNDALEASFNQRRIQEIQQLLALGRSEEVTFSGIITVQNGTNWIIASLPVIVQPDVPNASTAHLNDEVQVTARTTEQRTITAIRVQIVESAASPMPTPTVSTLVPTVVIPTQTPTVTATNVPSATATLTFTPQPTNTQVIPTRTSAPTTVPTTASTPQIIISTPTTAQCTPTRPDNWVSYQIRAGDTLSALATNTEISLTNLMSVNCITDAGRIVVGETIYLPRLPNIASTVPPTTSSNPDAGSNNSGTGSNDSGNVSPTDDHGGDSDNSGHGGNSGSGGSGGGSDDGSGHT